MTNNQLKYIVFGGLFVVPFIPLIIANSLFFPFIVGKAFAFRFIVEIIFGIWVILAIRDQSYRPKFSWLFTSILLFLVIIGIADFLSANPFKSFWSNYERMEGFVGIAHLVMYFVVCGSMIQSEKIWNRLFATSLGASFIMSVYSFLQLAGKITINQGGVRVDGTFGNASYLAVYMLFHIFIASLLFLRTDKRWHKILLIILSIANLVILYYTATRGAILGLIGGSILTLVLFAIQSEKGSRFRKLSVYSMITVCVLIGIFVVFKNNPKIANNSVLGRFSSLSFSEIKSQGRFYVWPMAYKGFIEKPIFGWGQESFNYVFNKYYDPRMYRQEAWFDRTHNIILDWAISAGSLGLLSYLSIFVILLVSIWKVQNDNLTKKEKSIITGLLFGYFFHNLFVFDQIGSYILFFMILAYVHSLSVRTPHPFLSNLSLKIKNLFERDSHRVFIEGFIGILVLLVIYFVVYIPYKVNKNLLSILSITSQGKVVSINEYSALFSSYTIGFSEALEHISQSSIGLLSSNGVPNQLKQDLFSLLNNSFQKQLSVSPNDARYRLFYGVFLSRYGNYEKGLEQLKIASSLSPKKQSISFEIASNLLILNKPKEALEVAKKAYDLEPNFEEAKFVYGLVALSVGDVKLATNILGSMSENRLVYDDRFLSVLVQIGDIQKAIDVVRLRISRDPKNVQHRITLAAVYLGQNRRQEAIYAIQEAVNIDPNFKETGEFYINEIKAGRNP